MSLLLFCSDQTIHINNPINSTNSILLNIVVNIPKG